MKWYETCLSGKMHFVGPDQLHGFKRRIMPDIAGMCGISRDLPDWATNIPPGRRNIRDRLVKDPGGRDHEHMQYDEEVTQQSLRYLAEPERHTKPWILCASIYTPHFPFVCPPELFHYYQDCAELPVISKGHLEAQHPQIKNVRRYFDCDDIPDEQVRKARAAYYGLVEFADRQVGALLDSIAANGLVERTIVIYMSDHGEALGEHGLWYKCTFYEASVRVPLIVSWPSVVQPGSRHSQVVSLLDVVQTILDVAQADREFTDGASLLPLLDGTGDDGPGMAIAEYEGHGVTTACRMVRHGRYKLNFYHGEQSTLFDLDRDPDECEDLIENPSYSSVVKKLTDIALHEWDSQQIYDQVVRSQRERRITARGMDAPWSPTWRNGQFG